MPTLDREVYKGLYHILYGMSYQEYIKREIWNRQLQEILNEV